MRVLFDSCRCVARREVRYGCVCGCLVPAPELPGTCARQVLEQVNAYIPFTFPLHVS